MHFIYVRKKLYSIINRLLDIINMLTFHSKVKSGLFQLKNGLLLGLIEELVVRLVMSSSFGINCELSLYGDIGRPGN